MTSDAERIAYLSGDQSGALDDPEDTAGLDDLRALLADPALWEDPPDGLEDSVVAALTAAVEADPDPDPGSERADATSQAAPATPLAARRPRWARPAPLLGALAAAAAVVVAVLLVTTGSNDIQGYEAALTATDLVPQAEGTVMLMPTGSGWRIDLNASRLPRLDDGQYYQAWLRGADDVLVPVGSFNEGTNVILWAGASPKEFSTFTVTQEDADGDQASSGRRVLTGPIVLAD